MSDLPRPTLLAALAIAGLAVAATGSPVLAQSVAGHVVEEGTGRPIAFAGVTLADTAGRAVRSVAADSLGSFRFDAGPGRYRLRAQSMGYATSRSEIIELRKGEPIIVLLQMVVTGVPLKPLVVRARGFDRGRDAFNRHGKLGAGVFLDVDSLMLRQPRSALDAIRGVNGLMVKDTPTGIQVYSLSGGRCMLIYVDNNTRPFAFFRPAGFRSDMSTFGADSRQRTGDSRLALGGDSASLAMIARDDIKGVEVYRNFWEIPHELRTGERASDLWPEHEPVPCGMVIIWTTAAW